MKIFLDTSSLFKLYHEEDDSSDFELMFSKPQITNIFLSEISKIEFASAIWKKVRTRQISEAKAQVTLDLFELDLGKYSFVVTDSIIVEQARSLISKYGVQGLRTLDSIQLSTSLSLFKQVDVFFASDKLLKSFFKAEGLQTELPTQ